MRITCPSCQAAYDVPATVLAARRKLRCARCTTDFAPTEPDLPPPLTPPPLTPPPVTSPPVPPSAEPPPAPEPPMLVTPPVIAAPAVSGPDTAPGPVLLAAAWLISFAFLAALAWFFIAWRLPIMHAWPPSARLYAAIGYLR